MTLKREIKDAYIEGGNSIYVKTHSNAVYVDDNETETLTQRLDNIKGKIDNNTTQLNDIAYNNKKLKIGVGLGGRNINVIKDIGINTIKSLGIKIMRIEILWSKVEKTKGVFDFSFYDAILKELLDNGIELLLILDFDNPLYCSERGINTEEERIAFVNYVKATVTQYKDYNVSWEVWNEPNLETFWKNQDTAPYNYYLLLKDTYNAIKAITTTQKVYGGSLATTYRPETGYRYKVPDFFVELCLLGGLNYMDGLSIHPYSIQEPEMLGVVYNTYKGLIGSFNNKDMEILISEFGYTIPSDWDNLSITPLPSLSDEQRGQYFLRSFMVNLINGISTQLIHELYSPQTNNTDSEYWFSLFNADNTPTLSANIIKDFLTKLGNDSILLFHEQPRSADYFVYFKQNTGKIACVYWTRNIEHNINNRGIDFALTQTPQIRILDASLINLTDAIEEYNKTTSNDNADVLYAYNTGTIKSPEGGLIYGSTLYNYAGKHSSCFGNMNVSYSSKIYKITSINTPAKTITLEDITGLVEGSDVIIKENWGKCFSAKIISIDTANKTVTLNRPAYYNAIYLLYYPSNANLFGSSCEGVNNISCGYASHSEGVSTIALEEGCHAEGNGSIAIGLWSHASGRGTKATNAAQTVVGKYNNPHNDTLFEVGIGTADDNRANSFEVLAGISAFVLYSPNGSRFKISIDDNGNLTTNKLS